jgi:hypothetical protein
LNQNKQESNQNSLIESIFWYFSENLGLFWFVLKQFSLFHMFWYRFETPKQIKTNPKIFVFGFMKQTGTQPKQTETQPKHDLFLFVSVRTEIFFF